MATLNILIEIRNVSILSFVIMCVSKFRSKMYQSIHKLCNWWKTIISEIILAKIWRSIIEPYICQYAELV